MRSACISTPRERRQRCVLLRLERDAPTKDDDEIASAVFSAPCPHVVEVAVANRDGDVLAVIVAVPCARRRRRHGLASAPPSFLGRPRPRSVPVAFFSTRSANRLRCFRARSIALARSRRSASCCGVSTSFRRPGAGLTIPPIP